MSNSWQEKACQIESSESLSMRDNDAIEKSSNAYVSMSDDESKNNELNNKSMIDYENENEKMSNEECEIEECRMQVAIEDEMTIQVMYECDNENTDDDNDVEEIVERERELCTER